MYRLASVDLGVIVTGRLFDPILAAKATIARMTRRQPRGVDAVDLGDFAAIRVAAEFVGLRIAICAPLIQRFAHFADLPGAALS